MHFRWAITCCLKVQSLWKYVLMKCGALGHHACDELGHLQLAVQAARLCRCVRKLAVCSQADVTTFSCHESVF